jgi:predicted MFS family arabinose efflux permease
MLLRITGEKMNAINLLLIIIGIIIFISSFVSGGLLINLGSYGYFAWFIGLILVAIGLWRNEKEKKSK